MEKHRDNIQKLFLSSGCLSEDAIVLYLNRNAADEERKAIEEHLSGCELCAAAVEGYTYLAEEKSAEEIPAIISELKQNLTPKSSPKIGKKYIRPLLAVAAMLIILFSTFIVFRMIYKEKEPVLAKLSEHEIIKENIPDSTLTNIKPSIQPEVQNESKAIKTVTKGAVALDAVESQMSSPVLADNETQQQEEQQKPRSDEASKNEVLITNSAGSGLTGTNKSLAISQNNDITRNNYPAKAEELKQDSTYYLSYDKSYQVNASAPQSYTYISSDIKRSSAKDQSEISFVYPEVPPEFPGGSDSLIRFIENNLKYPEKAKALNIQGTVKISFYVEKNGSLSEIKVQKKIGYGCDEEALRIVKLMPEWIPGKQNGKTQRTKMVVPVKFSLKN